MNPFLSTDDGYSQTAFISGMADVRRDGETVRERQFPDLRIYFRPATVADRSAYEDRLRSLPDKNRGVRTDDLLMTEVVKRLKAWDFLDSDGKVMQELPTTSGKTMPVPEPSEDWLKRLKSDLLWVKLTAVIFFGSSSGDTDPFEEGDKDKKTPSESVKEHQGN